jgi:hypothetical protein
MELKCVVLGGMTILKMIRELDYNTLALRPQLKNKDKLAIFGKALFAFKRSTRLIPASAPAVGPREEKISGEEGSA